MTAVEEGGPASVLLTVQDQSQVTVTVRSDLFHLCPFRDEEDEGMVTISWRCRGMSIELHSLSEYLGCYEQCSLSNEQVTEFIRHDLVSLAGIEDVIVATTWATAGMEVRCSTSPTHAGATP